MANDITTLSKVKSWLGVTEVNDDALLERLISSASRYILSYIQRPSLLNSTYTETFDGYNDARKFLSYWPVNSVQSVKIGAQTINAAQSSNLNSSGYVVDAYNGLPPGKQQAVSLRGYIFYKGFSNVEITYKAGYVVANEPQITSTTNFMVNEVLGSFIQDEGVTLADGTALTKVTTAPAALQYSVSSEGKYTINAAQSNAALLVSYSYVPFDLEQACIELVAERYKYKDRISQQSKSLGGQETISFKLDATNSHIEAILWPYKRIIC